MDSTTVTSLTSAFDFGPLFDTFVLFAPWIMGIAGVVLGVSLIRWGIHAVRKRLSGGVA